MENKKEKKIVFSEEIDNAISGYALAITFIGIGVFLLNNLNYFGNQIVSIVVLSIFSFIGVIGTFIELGKNKRIKGWDDFGVGLFFFIPWLLIYMFGKNIWLNIAGFILLVSGVYGMLSGIIKVIVSIFYEASTKEKKFKNVSFNLFTTLPAIASFVLAIFNIIKIALEIKTM